MIRSNWKITWDPAGASLVLLDFGQDIAAELEMPFEQVIEDRRVIEGTATEPLPRKWAKGSLSFGAYKEHASDLAARNYVLSHRIAIAALAGLRKTLRIQPAGGSNTDIANAVIAAAVPAMSVDPDLGRTLTTYKILFPW